MKQSSWGWRRETNPSYPERLVGIFWSSVLSGRYQSELFWDPENQISAFLQLLFNLSRHHSTRAPSYSYVRWLCFRKNFLELHNIEKEESAVFCTFWTCIHATRKMWLARKSQSLRSCVSTSRPIRLQKVVAFPFCFIVSLRVNTAAKFEN